MILVDSNFGLHIWLLLNNKEILSKDVDISIDSTLYVNLIIKRQLNNDGNILGKQRRIGIIVWLEFVFIFLKDYQV